MFDVMYRVLPEGDWVSYGVSLPKARAETFAKMLERSRNDIRYAATVVAVDQPERLENPRARATAIAA